MAGWPSSGVVCVSWVSGQWRMGAVRGVSESVDADHVAERVGELCDLRPVSSPMPREPRWWVQPASKRRCRTASTSSTAQYGTGPPPRRLRVQRVEAELDDGDVEPGVHGIAVNIEVDSGVEDVAPPAGGLLFRRGRVDGGSVGASVSRWW